MATSLALHTPTPAFTPLATESAATPASLPLPPNISHPGVRRALQHLHARYAERVTLGELAEVARLSPFYFARLFRAQTGTTPGGYLRHLRIEHAKLLLRGGVPISRVAFSTGFYDQSHFTRRFKEDVGVPPGRFARVSPTIA